MGNCEGSVEDFKFQAESPFHRAKITEKDFLEESHQ